MSAEIIPLAAVRKSIVTIEAGIIAAGAAAGSHTFWVTLISEDLGNVIVWSGPGYPQAIHAASEFLQEGVVIRDLTGGVR